jgi:hypothetical protein
MAATHSKAYVLQRDALEILAGDDPALLRTDGAPNLDAISTAAKLDPTTIWRITTGKIGLSSWVMAALTELLMNRGYTRADAEAALFDLVDREDAAPRREAVPA